MKPIRVYFASGAHCLGKGTDQWKRVAGLPRKDSTEYNEMVSADIVLVESHTRYLGETVKRVLFTESGQVSHRSAPHDLRFLSFKPGLQTIRVRTP